MKLIQQTRLHYQDAKSDKIYEVDLCEVTNDTYLVNFRYGRRGKELREGTKTDQPVPLAKAQQIFDKLVNDKTKKGYQDASQPFVQTATTTPEPIEEETPKTTPVDTFEFPEIRKFHILKSLQEYVQPLNTTPLSQKTTTPESLTPPPTTEGNETLSPKLNSIFERFKKWVNPSGETSAQRPQGNASPVRNLKNIFKKEEAQKRPLARLLWRVGEFRIQEAVPYLTQVEQGANPLFNYCLAWAIGRCGDLAGLPTLEKMTDHAKQYPFLHDILREAKMACLDEKTQTQLAAIVLENLPIECRTAIQSESEITLLQVIHSAFQMNLTSNEMMADLYLISNHYPVIRKALLQWIKEAPLKGGGYFRTFRQFYKAAEFRDDAELLGLVAYRIQKARPMVTHMQWGGTHFDGQWIQNRDEVKKKNSRIGFSKTTKDYFERRAWRTLNRKGEVGDPSYVKMATGILLNYTDADELKVRSHDYWNYFRDANGRWQSQKTTLHYTPFTCYLTLSNILFKNSPRFEINKGKNKWLFKTGVTPQTPSPQVREEAYPELWDKVPQGLLHLLAESESRAVHEFAVKAAKANLAKVTQLVNLDFVKILLNKSYENTARFGLDLARAKYNPNQPNIDLVNILLNVNINEARAQGIAWVNAQRGFFFNDADFVVKLLFNPYEDVTTWADQLLSETLFQEEKSQVVIARAIALMMAFDENATEVEKKSILNAGTSLTKHFQKPLSKTSFDLINDLLHHPLVEVQVFGAKILLNHETKPEDLPEELLLGLINGSSPEMREVGVELLGKLPPENLLKRKNLLYTLCISQYPEVRKAVHPIVTDLSKKHPDFGDELVVMLSPSLLYKEENEGRDEDVLKLLMEDLKAHLGKIPLSQTLNLLYAPRKAAHVLGNHLLQNHTQQQDLTMRQIVRLGDNEMVAIRQWVKDIYNHHTDRIQNELAEAVRLCDAKWDDVRDFSFDFFREKINEEYWTPEILVSICDSVKPMVQQFGKELITKHFKEENGEQYLLQLSQHPTKELQSFATNYLERFATDKPEHIKKLKHYFITVLSGVNKSRVAKKRIFDFLKNEGMKNAGVAKIVAEVLERQSATMAIGDKARCIHIMRDLQQHFDGLEVPLEKIEFEDYPINV